MEAQVKSEQHCSVEACKRPYRAKGYCNVHFRKWRRGELDVRPRYKACVEEKCNKPLFRKGLCEEHYKAWSLSLKGTTGEVASAGAAAQPLVPEKPDTPA